MRVGDWIVEMWDRFLGHQSPISKPSPRQRDPDLDDLHRRQHELLNRASKDSYYAQIERKQRQRDAASAEVRARTRALEIAEQDKQ